MKQLRLVALVLAASLACAAIAFACGAGKSANASASAAGASCCAGGANASAANTKGAAGKCTPEMQASCTPEMKAACSASGASAGACGMHGTSASAAMECAVCAEGASCDEDVNAAGAHRQVVALKNGAMLVYTADGPEGVRALQASVARHNATLMAVLAGQRAGKLCSHCKPLRGAMASGKLVREVVNVQRGAQIVITSTDRATVQRIHDMTGAQVAARVHD
ncbi:MAG: hypothetical protein KAY61_01190 [Candidatus Eisenbacteria bacterium]|jgi:hypothetical protein|nr:hypothetical protein [Candidatus Eisenbacteria bacterium]MBP8136789.1 hypothetical protein [Candidatus Eisenbacteria bacterium]